MFKEIYMQQCLVRMQSLEMNNIILQRIKKKMKEPKNSFKTFFLKKHVMNMHQTKIGSNTRNCIGFSFFRCLSRSWRRVEIGNKDTWYMQNLHCNYCIDPSFMNKNYLDKHALDAQIRINLPKIVNVAVYIIIS